MSGWKKDKIYPDFIVAKKNNKDNSLELVYILESKGEHLLGNADTVYKKGIFDKINLEINTKKIKEIGISKFKINKKFDFEFVEGENEGMIINRLLN